MSCMENICLCYNRCNWHIVVVVAGGTRVSGFFLKKKKERKLELSQAASRQRHKASACPSGSGTSRISAWVHLPTVSLDIDTVGQGWRYPLLRGFWRSSQVPRNPAAMTAQFGQLPLDAGPQLGFVSLPVWQLPSQSPGALKT